MHCCINLYTTIFIQDLLNVVSPADNVLIHLDILSGRVLIYIWRMVRKNVDMQWIIVWFIIRLAFTSCQI